MVLLYYEEDNINNHLRHKDRARLGPIFLVIFPIIFSNNVFDNDKYRVYNDKTMRSLYVLRHLGKIAYGYHIQAEPFLYRHRRHYNMATLAEIRAKLQAAQNNNSQSGGFTGDNAIYPHWNMAEGKEATVRFLPDGNSANTFFWVERAMIKLPFSGIVGDTNAGPCQVQVPCVEMYNDNSVCPILSEVRPWFKDKSLEEMGRKYWKKRSYIFQGFVTDDPMNEENTPDNPIRRFIIGPQIFQLIKSALLDPELEEMPTDYLRGVDFKIIKTSKGGYADYSTSKWSRRESALSDAQKAAIEQFGLYDLSEFLPKKPTDVELKVIKEMFEASVDGEAYDPERWGQYYKPAGLKQATGDPNVQAEEKVAPSPKAATPKAAPAQEQEEADDVPFDTEEKQEATGNENRANDILAMIRSRQKQS